MKRVISFVLICVLALSLCGCSSEKKVRSEFSEEGAEIAVKALGFLDEFVNNTMGAGEVKERIDKLHDELGDEQYDKLLSFNLTAISTSLLLYDMGSTTTTRKDIENDIEELKDFIYK